MMSKKRPVEIDSRLTRRDDGRNAARGVIYGVVFATPVWLAIAALVIHLARCA